MHLFKTTRGVVLRRDGADTFIDHAWDDLVSRDDLPEFLESLVGEHDTAARTAVEKHLLPPIGQQEIWASGVTYFSSRLARMEESEAAGGADFYHRVYHAERPELFFKSTAGRVAGHGQSVRIRRDSKWDVPEPELTLVMAPSGRIVGYTVGNDMSSRSIEAENPLYLPQAKTYHLSAGIGPGVWVPGRPIPEDTAIAMCIFRDGEVAFEGTTDLSALNRRLEDLAGWLFRELDFPRGVYLMTGTGIVPDASFTLQPGDRVEIAIDSVGTLVQTVERA